MEIPLIQTQNYNNFSSSYQQTQLKNNLMHTKMFKTFLKMLNINIYLQINLRYNDFERKVSSLDNKKVADYGKSKDNQ